MLWAGGTYWRDGRTIRRAPGHTGHCSHSDPDVPKQGSGKRDQCGAQLCCQGLAAPPTPSCRAPAAFLGSRLRLDSTRGECNWLYWMYSHLCWITCSSLKLSEGYRLYKSMRCQNRNKPLSYLASNCLRGNCHRLIIKYFAQNSNVEFALTIMLNYKSKLPVRLEYLHTILIFKVNVFHKLLWVLFSTSAMEIKFLDYKVSLLIHFSL